MKRALLSVIAVAVAKSNACGDTNDLATDAGGDGCDWYVLYPHACGGYNDFDFDSNSMCCACGGGYVGIANQTDGNMLVEDSDTGNNGGGGGSSASMAPASIWAALVVCFVMIAIAPIAASQNRAARQRRQQQRIVPAIAPVPIVAQYPSPQAPVLQPPPPPPPTYTAAVAAGAGAGVASGGGAGQTPPPTLTTPASGKTAADDGITLAEAMAQGMAQETFSLIDVDNNGFITQSEFAEWMVQHAPAKGRDSLENLKEQYEQRKRERQYWESDGTVNDVNLYMVAQGTAEFRAITNEFAKTLPDMKIWAMQRVENAPQHEYYLTEARNIKEDVGYANWTLKMEQLLWHGTTAVEEIVNSGTHGFLPGLAGTKTGTMYGKGVYFARDAKYSHHYARVLPDGKHQMLASKVARIGTG